MKPNDLIEHGYVWLDDRARESARLLARLISRRSFLGRLGAIFAGAAVLPLLPVARSFAQEPPQEIGDPQTCEYWRYCALGGFLCSCCGGSEPATTLPITGTT
jgi:methylamine dehydrogenase light chain